MQSSTVKINAVIIDDTVASANNKTQVLATRICNDHRENALGGDREAKGPAYIIHVFK